MTCALHLQTRPPTWTLDMYDVPSDMNRASQAPQSVREGFLTYFEHNPSEKKNFINRLTCNLADFT